MRLRDARYEGIVGDHGLISLVSTAGVTRARKKIMAALRRRTASRVGVLCKFALTLLVEQF
jgi:hypothetical protein